MRGFTFGILSSFVLFLAAFPGHTQVISDLQDTSHRSSFEGQNVETEGVVTAVLDIGFFMQGEADGSSLSSDGIFVFTRNEPNIEIGDVLRVEGELVEFARPKQLPLTQIVGPTITVLSSDAPLPTPVEIGAGALMPPTEVIDDDSFAEFDPESDGIDFYETLEGMRVTLKDAVALSTKDRFDDFWVLPTNGAGATNFVAGSALTLSESDGNPERLLIDFDIVGPLSDVEAGTRIGEITGVLSYNFGTYRVYATEIITVAETAAQPSGVTSLEVPDGTALSVAVYNVQNLDPKVEVLSDERAIDDDVGSGKFDAIAEQIVDVLQAPAIIALQEVQDNDGAENTAVTSASETLSVLIAAITAQGGPAYDFLDFPPNDDQDGGQPGGNIRSAFLYDPARASLISDSAKRILDPSDPMGGAFFESRKPVMASFETALGSVTLANVHFASRRGSDPSFGANQPPMISDAATRRMQSRIVGEHLSRLFDGDPNANVIVLGDFNAHYFETELELLEDEFGFFNLWRTRPEDARRSYVFEGQAQAYDHILVSSSLRAQTNLLPANVNAGRLGQASDHDPLLAVFGSAIPADGGAALALKSSVGGIDGRTHNMPLPPDDLEGEDLRAWLQEHWFDGHHQPIGYEAARRAMYSFVDVAEDGRVYGVYTGFNQEARDVTFLNPINPEHTVPQSWFNKSEPMRSDIHNLFPTHKDVNSARGSDPFAEISDSETTRWYGLSPSNRLTIKTQPPTDDIDSYSEDTRSEFEPPEDHEGNLARAAFYFYTMYPDRVGEIDDLASDGIKQLAEWHVGDPVDPWELERNLRVEEVQGNRNPFIDHPELVCRAWPRAC